MKSCRGNASCAVWSWSPNSKNCYWRLDGEWETQMWTGYVAGCQADTVWGCTPPGASCPSYVHDPDMTWPLHPASTVARAVALKVQPGRGTVAADRFRGLGVNFDFWWVDLWAVWPHL